MLIATFISITFLSTPNFQGCDNLFVGRVFEYQPRVDVHKHTILFHCFDGKTAGVIFGPSPEGEHGLYFFSSKVEQLTISGDSISFEFSKGNLFSEQITLDNYTKTDELEEFGFSRTKLNFKGKFSNNRLLVECTSEYYECYDSSLNFVAAEP